VPERVRIMRDLRPAGLDPAHVLAICARATGGRRGLAVRRTDGIIVCILPSQRTASQASTALARVGYEITSVSASRGRDLLVTGWDPEALDARLITMRTALHWLADQPSTTAQLAIERFRGSPDESRTSQQIWEVLNQARDGLRRWVTARSGVHALQGLVIQPADARIAMRLRAATVLEQAIDDQAERQLRVAGCALVLFRRLSGQMDDDRAQDTAIRWASMAFHLSSPAAHNSPHAISRRNAAEFPRSALTPSQAGNAVSLDPARRSAHLPQVPRLRP
jgi:hypothetical protein